MKIELSKENADQIRTALVTQVGNLDFSKFSLVIDQSEKTVFLSSADSFNWWQKTIINLSANIGIILVIVALFIGYAVVSCNARPKDSYETRMLNKSYTENTERVEKINLPSGKTITNSVSVTHSVTNVNRQ